MTLGTALLLLVGSVSDDLLTADPDAAIVELGYRQALRGKVGARLFIVAPREETPSLSLSLPAMVELHNDPYSDWVSVVPWELWRGRLALELGYQHPLEKAWSLGAKLALEHESDHPTGSAVASADTTGFINLNDVAVGVWARHRGRGVSWGSLMGRLHVLTCTIEQHFCGAQGGIGGDRSLEGVLDIGQSYGLSNDGAWSASASAHASILAPTVHIAPEHRS